MIQEVWKTIPGYPRYQVSNYGRVKSFTSPKAPHGKIMKIFTNKNGYKVVHLSEGTKRQENPSRVCQVHRLVAQAFIPIPPELSGYSYSDLVVDHITPISNIKSGNTIINEETGEFNIRWCTPEFNQTGNTLTNINRLMAVQKLKQKVYVYDENLNLVATYESTADAARILNKSQGNIASCCTGALPRYLSWIWSYEPLTDMEQRNALEEKMRYQFEKNRQSTYQAVQKCQKRAYREGRSWYHRHREEAKARCRKYYNEHKEEISRKLKERRQAKNDRERVQET